MTQIRFPSFSRCALWVAGLGTCGLVAFGAHADEKSELIRLRGFAEHQSEETQFERLRQRGQTEHLEEVEQWQRQKDQALGEYKKQKAANAHAQKNDSVGAIADAKEKETWDRDYDKNRQAYVTKQKAFERAKHPELVTENEELDLNRQRPRYDYKKRVLYGAPLKYGKAGSGSSSHFGGGSGNSTYTPPAPAPFGTSPNNFPPPPSYDDFGDGYIPPPTLGDGFGDDLPPPPPPPAMDDFNSPDMIPPPPPPPPFMDDGGEF